MLRVSRKVFRLSSRGRLRHVWKVERGPRADGAIEDFAVIADGFDDLVAPVVIQVETPLEAAAGAGEGLDGLEGAGAQGVHVGAGDAVYFGLDEGGGGPVDHAGPVWVVRADDGGEGIQAEAVWQDFEIMDAAVEGGAADGEFGDVMRFRVALAADEGGFHFADFLEGEGRDPDAGFGGGVPEVVLRGGWCR